MEKKKGQEIWQRIRQIPLLYNLLWIAAILLVLLLAFYLAMHIGTRHGARRTVPEMTGILLSEAEQLAVKSDLELIVADSLFVPAYEGGIVLDLLPEPGVEVKPGRKIYITINSFSEKMVPLPYVAGRSLRQAKNMLEIAGLEIDELIYRPDMATNYVLEQRYKGNLVNAYSKIMAEAGSGVTLYVGVKGEENSDYVPQVIGRSERDAKSRLWESGFNVGEIHYDEGINLLNRKDARVYKQSPALGTPLTLGRKVSLWLTLDEELTQKQTLEAEEMARKIAAERREQEEAAKAAADQEASTGEPTELSEPAEEPAEDEFFQ